MTLRLARRVFGSSVDRRLSRYGRTVREILALAPEHRGLSPAALRECMQDLREKAAAGVPLKDLTTPLFAVVSEASRRALGEEPTQEQLIGGLALQDGCIAEMKTGEGKTLTGTLFCALSALAGRGVHVAAANDYLAERDANWMRPVYETLGLSVGLITQQLDDDLRRAAYACDVTYGVASEFAFDYLRDNMKFSAAETVQRGHAFALIDEADAVLIDEAGMPLALFGPLGEHSVFYSLINSIVSALTPHEFEVDDRRRVVLTERGYDAVERALRQASLLKAQVSLQDIEAISLLHHTLQALRAHALLARDRDYIVQDGEIVIIDKFTGRMMPGRRYDEGLHQALEAKEGCAIGEETRTLASITFQTFFQRYEKLAGMTGTAEGDMDEYREVYGLDVVQIPTHRPLIRHDEAFVHPTRDEKLRAILDDVESANAKGQPVLIGASSIEQSDRLAGFLEAHGWTRGDDPSKKKFEVINARHHANEARVIAQAGMPGAVTIATAMAGRGTDIRLGGAGGDPALRDRAITAGGLLVIGTEHHAYRRLDVQLRGRSGRQGDPGRSIFHASLEDDLLNAGSPLAAVKEHLPVDATAAQRLVSAVQRRNETQSFNNRMGLLRFETVIQRQLDTVYGLRRSVRDDPQPLALVNSLRNDTIDDLMERFAPASGPWDITGLDAVVRSILTLAIPIAPPSKNQATDCALLRQRICVTADGWMQQKVDTMGRNVIDDIVRRIMMAMLDQLWTEQLERLEHLKRMVGDRHLQASKALAEFRIEAFALYELLMKDFRQQVTAYTMRCGTTTRP